MSRISDILALSPNNSKKMDLSISETIIRKLKKPINLENANPNFQHNQARLSMTVAELSEFMERYEIEYFYRRSEILRGKTTTSDPEHQGSMAGMDIYKCSCAGKPRTNQAQGLRSKPSQKCGCRARLTIQFLNGYDHAPDNRLNVREHGSKIVNLSWFHKHNHNFNDLKEFLKAPLSPLAHNLLKTLVLQHDITWNQIFRMQTEILNSEDPPPCEFMKIRSHHVQYILKHKQSDPFKGIPIVDSSDISATAIRSSQEFASNIVDSQTATQTREAEEQHSIRLYDEKLIKAVRSLLRRRLELTSAEEIHNYVGSVCDRINKCIQDSRNPLAKQG